ncbi:uncharacterized protein BX663DRAFT_513646 [Cokeromyces recurvatus]|uniref:uncharacterized protein n=1 Tax=Cokeromyces recurvatus TaxID=90255 RepID=UPI00221F0C82|nr:uncharacterized protein BX663DRAFT_513646 [Cokeromyces recurvatus]KAI7901674.1 hypothetical protein BX663DRAFT_513646 [Cokeromyces recurvatus]
MYVNWEAKSIQAIETLKWYPITRVIEYLHELRRFIIETPGKYSASYLPQLIKTTSDTIVDSTSFYILPASRNKRFPSDMIYICEAVGDWSLKLDNLALAANIMVHTNRLDRKYPNFQEPGQVEYYALKLINELLSTIASQKNLCNQFIFEDKYGLQWDEEDTST